MNAADEDRDARARGDNEGRGMRRNEGEERLHGKGGLLYHVPCANRHGIPLTCRVDHGRLFSRTKNHPTISSSANNTQKLILRTGTGMRGRGATRREKGGGEPRRRTTPEKRVGYCTTCLVRTSTEFLPRVV